MAPAPPLGSDPVLRPLRVGVAAAGTRGVARRGLLLPLVPLLQPLLVRRVAPGLLALLARAGRRARLARPLALFARLARGLPLLLLVPFHVALLSGHLRLGVKWTRGHVNIRTDTGESR